MKVGDEFLVDLVGLKSALFICSPNNFWKFLQPGDAVSGHYPLRRIGQEEFVRTSSRSTRTARTGPKVVRGAWRKCGLQHHQIILFQDLA